MLTAAASEAQTLGYAGSFYATGWSYEGQRARTVYLFQSVDLATGPLRVSGSVPLLRQNTRTETVDLGTVEETSAGFGDPLLRVDLRVLDDRARGLHVAVAASVKPTLVDPESGLGTGAADYGVGASAFRSLGRASVFVDTLFWKYGDPDGFDFDDALSYSVGVARLLGSGRWSSSVSVSGLSPVGGAPAPVQLTLGVLALAGRGQSLAVSASFGLTETATDFSVGTSWRIQG